MTKAQEENQEEVKERIDRGEMILLESTWDDPKEEEAEQRENMSDSKPTSQGMIFSLIIHRESCAHNASLAKNELRASAHPHPNNLFQLHTPQKHSHHLFTCGKPSQKAPN